MRVDDRLARIDAQIVELPAARIMQTARGAIVSEILILIRIQTSQGICGHSYVRCYTSAPAMALRFLIEANGEFVVGLPLDSEVIQAAFNAEYALLGTKGLAGIAISAIDMAMWDAIGIAQNQSLRQLLSREGALPRPYTALSSMDGNAAAREAEQAAKAGFAGVKYKAGKHDSNTDTRALAAIRSAIGWDTALMVDYNQKLSLDDAQRRLTALEQFDLEWIEEPLSTDDHRGYVALRQSSTTPIQLGENLCTVGEVLDCLPGADVVALDLGRIGGVSGWLVAEAAVGGRRPLSNHAYCEVSAQLLVAKGPRQWVEWGVQARPLLAEPPEILSGEIRLPDFPGTGVSFDEAAVHRWRTG